jgi:hypothetical protein
MVRAGCFMSCEEFDAPELVRQAALAEDQAVGRRKRRGEPG